jgi:hypothetical protein
MPGHDGLSSYVRWMAGANSLAAPGTACHAVLTLSCPPTASGAAPGQATHSSRPQDHSPHSPGWRAVATAAAGAPVGLATRSCSPPRPSRPQLDSADVTGLETNHRFIQVFHASIPGAPAIQASATAANTWDTCAWQSVPASCCRWQMRTYEFANLSTYLPTKNFGRHIETKYVCGKSGRDSSVA